MSLIFQLDPDMYGNRSKRQDLWLRTMTFIDPVFGELIWPPLSAGWRRGWKWVFVWGSAKLQADLREESHAFNMDYIKLFPQHVFPGFPLRLWTLKSGLMKLHFFFLPNVSVYSFKAHKSQQGFVFLASSSMSSNSLLCSIGQIACNHCVKSEFYFKKTGVYEERTFFF